jgi:restriction system protein
MPAFDEMMWPTLQALKDSNGSSTNQDLLVKVVQMMNLSEEIQSLPHGDGPRTEIEYRLLWARSYLRKVGAIDTSKRSVWFVTPAGRALTEADMKIVRQVQAMYHRPRGTPPETAPELPNLDPVDENWREQLLSILQNMPPDAFECLARRILLESGFVDVDRTGGTGDGGIDGLGVLRVNLISFRVFFQCKRYKASVGSGEIRDFRGAMVGRTDKGLFITTGHFTADAKQEAARDGAPQIELIDGEQLCDLLKGLNLGLKTELVEHVSVVPETFKQFEIEETPSNKRISSPRPLK